MDSNQIVLWHGYIGQDTYQVTMYQCIIDTLQYLAEKLQRQHSDRSYYQSSTTLGDLQYIILDPTMQPTPKFWMCKLTIWI